uniref:Predicted protein n=1 Tax=Hordeum vulgare subsp. vulgare TaxID=112509 RepID=F2DMS9_HORVV|nr:predicted protein [Hordeum vulgare subsp. vulgare]
MSKEEVIAGGDTADVAVEKAPYWDPPPAPLLDTSELTRWSLYRAVIAEFVATLIFLYVSLATVIGYKSLGAAVMYNQHKAWKDHWIFWVGPLLGATVAALYHRFVLRGEAAKALGSFRSTGAATART